MTIAVTGEPLSTTLARHQLQLDQQAAEIAALYELIAKAWLSELRNVSSQILLVASGEPFGASKSTRFKSLGGSDPSIQTAAASLGVSPQEFIAAADGIVARRNRAIHPNDVEELDEAVQQVASLITPTMERLAKWECDVVKNYEAIKAAFKTSFGA